MSPLLSGGVEMHLWDRRQHVERASLASGADQSSLAVHLRQLDTRDDHSCTKFPWCRKHRDSTGCNTFLLRQRCNCTPDVRTSSFARPFLFLSVTCLLSLPLDFFGTLFGFLRSLIHGRFRSPSDLARGALAGFRGGFAGILSCVAGVAACRLGIAPSFIGVLGGGLRLR